MKTAIGTVMKALILAGLWGTIGVGVNFISAEPVPWIYEPPKSVDIAGVVLETDEPVRRLDVRPSRRSEGVLLHLFFSSSWPFRLPSSADGIYPNCEV